MNKIGILIHYINMEHVPEIHRHEYMEEVVKDITGDITDSNNVFNCWDNLFHFVQNQPSHVQVIRSNELSVDTSDTELVDKIKQVIFDHESSWNNRTKELL